MNKKMISLEIDEELKEALRLEAFKRAISVSALIRHILTEHLQPNKKAKEQVKTHD